MHKRAKIYKRIVHYYFPIFSTLGTRKCPVQLPIVKLHKNTPSLSGIINVRGTDRQTCRQAETHRNVKKKRVILPRLDANPQQKYEIVSLNAAL